MTIQNSKKQSCLAPSTFSFPRGANSPKHFDGLTMLCQRQHRQHVSTATSESKAINTVDVTMAAKLLLWSSDYAETASADSNKSLAVSGFAAFVALWAIEYIAVAIYSLFQSQEIFSNKKYRTILGRHTMDFIAMIAMAVMGFEALYEMGGWQGIKDLPHPSEGE
jgi:hypothetical protein